MRAKGLSAPATTLRVIELLADVDWKHSKVADVGAGRGHFTRVLGEQLEQVEGLRPADHIFPCDLIPESFEYDDVECHRTLENGRLPFDDASFDAVISIEVIEHVEDQFAFLRELVRIAKPGAHIIVTTPNVLNLSSRVRTLFWGFPQLFDPLPLENQDIRLMSGHIHPISAYYLAYAAQRSGISNISLHGDKTKRSAAFWALIFSPILALARISLRRRMQRKQPEVGEQNRETLTDMEGWEMLTARTAILAGQRLAAPLGSSERGRSKAAAASA